MQHNNLNSTKLEQTPTLYNKKERIGHTTLQLNFKQYVDKYIAKRESITASRRGSQKAFNHENPKSRKKPKRNNRPRCTNNKTHHNQFEGNSIHLNSKVASPLSSKNSLDISPTKQIHKKSDNNVSKFWEIFQIKQDSDKTSNKAEYYRDGIPSDNEGKNMLEPSTSSYSKEKSRAHKNRNLTTMDILPTDDPT